MLEIGRFLVMVNNTGEHFFGRVESNEDEVAILGTLSDDLSTVLSVYESPQIRRLSNYRVSYASTRTINTYYERLDPGLLDYIIQGSLL